MLGLANSKTSRDLMKDCTRYFLQKGWKISSAPDIQDFDLEAKDLRLRLICVDQSLMSYQSPSMSIENMASISRNRRTWIPLVFVFNFEFPVESYDLLLDRGVIAVSENQLELIGDLPSLIINPAKDFAPRQVAILGQNTWACLSISKSCKLSGDSTNAVLWAKRAIKPDDSVGSAHQVAFNTLMSEGETDAAYDLAAGAVLRRSDNRFFLQALIKISKQRGDEKAAAHWSHLLNKVEGQGDGPLAAILGSPKREHQSDATVKPNNKAGVLARLFGIR